MAGPLIAGLLGALLSIYVRLTGWTRATPEGQLIGQLFANWPAALVLLGLAALLWRSSSTLLLAQIAGAVGAFWAAFVFVGPAMYSLWTLFSPLSI